jgi:hypothetical protein
VSHPLITRFTTIHCAAVVFLAVFVALAWNVAQDGIGAAYTDPIARMSAGDEPGYVNSTIRMTQDGDWLTPKAWGRLFLQKPPLMYWLSGLSIKLFGTSLFTIRLPELLMGAICAAAVCLWCAQYSSMLAGALAAAMLVTCPVFLTLSRLVYTDMLSAGFITLAMTAVALDPRIERRRTWICLGVFTGAAILAKSIAGLLPLVALLVYWIAAPSKLRPSFSRLVAGGTVALLVAAPWHVYQFVVHPRWFWADYIDLAILGVGTRQPSNSVFNRPVLFYAERLWQLDPVLTLFALTGIVGAIWALRWRERLPDLLATCWALVTILAMASFQAKNLPYLVMLLPPICVLGGLTIPRRAILIGILLLALKMHPSSPPIAGAKAIRAYYELHRQAELVAVETDDHFWSGTISLPRVRYAWVDPSHILLRQTPFYGPLGIMITAEEFLALPSLQTTYEGRLREWGENSAEPIGTGILLSSPADLSAMIRADPGADYYLPATWTDEIAQAEPTHQIFRYSPDRVFLLSRSAAPRREPVTPIPARW